MGRVELLQKIRQCSHLVMGGFGGVGFLQQLEQGSGGTAAEGIYGVQQLSVAVGEILRETVRVHGPIALPGPCIAPEIPQQDIVFQQVSFLRGQAG